LGYVARDIEQAIEQFTRRTGARLLDLTHDLRDESGDVLELENLAHLAMPGVEIEIIQPRRDRPSIYLDALPDDPRDVALHHLGFILPDQAAWQMAIDRLDVSTPVSWTIGNRHAQVAYVDTRKQTGHYSELVVFADLSSRQLPA
jgi:hypothetical protein